MSKFMFFVGLEIGRFVVVFCRPLYMLLSGLLWRIVTNIIKTEQIQSKLAVSDNMLAEIIKKRGEQK